MAATKTAQSPTYLAQSTSRKVNALPEDSLHAWIHRYQQMAVVGVRSEAIARKIALHLRRFQEFFHSTYGEERISSCLRRHVLNWQQHLQQEGLAVSTINNHIASLSAFTTWGFLPNAPKRYS